MAATHLFQRILSTWRATVIDLGLYALIIIVLSTAVVSAPRLLLDGAMGMILTVLIGIPVGIASYVAQIGGYIVVDDYLEDGEVSVGRSLDRIAERTPTILGAIFLLTAVGVVGSFLLMIPVIIASIFSLIYLPCVATSGYGPIKSIGESMRLIGKQPISLVVLLIMVTAVIMIATILYVAVILGVTTLAGPEGMVMAFGIAGAAAMVGVFLIAPLVWSASMVVYRDMAYGEDLLETREAHATVEAEPEPEVASPNPDAPSRTAQFAVKPITMELESVSGPGPGSRPAPKAPPVAPYSTDATEDVVERDADFVGFDNTQEFRAFYDDEENRFQGFGEFETEDGGQGSEDGSDDDPRG